VKTDRRDARTLALALRAGQVTGIHIPTKEDESVRDYLRMYEDFRSDLRKTKQRVQHFLLRRGIRYQQGRSWTQRHKQWLSGLELERPLDREILDGYLGHLVDLQSKCAEVICRLEQIAEGERYREPVKKLKAFKGIKTLIAQVRAGAECGEDAADRVRTLCRRRSGETWGRQAGDV
jgi:transposase